MNLCLNRARALGSCIEQLANGSQLSGCGFCQDPAGPTIAALGGAGSQSVHARSRGASANPPRACIELCGEAPAARNVGSCMHIAWPFVTTRISRGMLGPTQARSMPVCVNPWSREHARRGPGGPERQGHW
jgi:hypothetical protein